MSADRVAGDCAWLILAMTHHVAQHTSGRRIDIMTVSRQTEALSELWK